MFGIQSFVIYLIHKAILFSGFLKRKIDGICICKNDQNLYQYQETVALLAKIDTDAFLNHLKKLRE